MGKSDTIKLIIPVERGTGLDESAAGGLRDYANVSLMDQEKDVWREEMVKKHGITEEGG